MNPPLKQFSLNRGASRNQFPVSSLTLRMVSGAALGAGAVLMGHALEWPNFSGRSGFLGTHYMDSILYSIGNDTISICVIASIWGVYGAFIVSIVTWPLARR